MRRGTSVLTLTFLIVALTSATGYGQVPTGTLAGSVTDPSGALVSKAMVTLTNRETGFTRTIETGSEGTFSAASLPAGEYELKVVAKGFSTLLRTATVVTGSTTTVNAPLQVGATTEILTITGATASVINYESNTVQGTVGRQQIESLPLNGRSFLNLAQLEPGVIVFPGNPAQFNAQFNVSVLGGPASHTAITVDGGNIRNPVEGGTGQNFSQEVVQEFQLSSTNFDLSTGITAFGAINIVSRGGGNDFHGSAYFYYRDHNISAYPSLGRTPVTNDPFFARRQSGFVISGPIKKDKAFFFFNLEHTNQDGVYVVQPDLPSVAGFSTLIAAPYTGTPFTGRIDYNVSKKHTAFLRFSFDGNTNAGPFTAAIPTLPSNHVSNDNYVWQGLLAVTSVLSPKVVNDLRFSYGYWQNRNIPTPCAGNVNGYCIGAAGPEVYYLNSVNFALGNNFNSPQGRDLRRYPVSDNVSWEMGSHRLKFGGEWEHFDGTGYWGFFDPARAYLLSPEFLQGVGIPLAFFPALGLPADGKIHGLDDLKKLPVVAFLLGIGDRAQPSYHLDDARRNERFHLYIQDTWRMTPRFTLNYGLGWVHETNVLNHDLSKPALVAPLYGNDLSPTKKQYKNFEPAAGIAWSFGKDSKTVLRAGAGIFYDTQLGWWRLGERAVIGGSGRQFIGNSAVTRIDGSGQNFTTTYLNSLAYRYGQFLAELPALRAQQDAKYPGKGDQPQILLSKQANALGALYPQDFPTTQAQHFNVGFQHQLGHGFLVQGDFVYRHMIHGTPGGFFGASVDYNKLNQIGGPVIPVCTPAQANDPNAKCSSGTINFWWPGATSSYKALLAKLDKRFSNRYQLTVSYSLQSSQSVLDVTQNLNNFFATYGPDLPHHNLTVSGTVDLPWKFQVSLLSLFLSHPPTVPVIGGVNDAGTDTSSGGYTALLGALGRGYSGFISQRELASLVNQYNTLIAGTLTPAGKAGAVPGAVANQRYPTVALPANYQLGDLVSSQDIRVTKIIGIHERVQLRLIGEVFNLFNISNVSNFNYNLVGPVVGGVTQPNAAFGQANQRVGQTFGSGGPRAFQFAARVSF